MADSLKTRLAQELKEALKAGDKCRLSTIRMLMAAVKNAEIEKRGELTEPEILGIVARECKKRTQTTPRNTLDNGSNSSRGLRHSHN